MTSKNHIELLPDGNALITLTRGHKTMVDVRDLALLAPYKWMAWVSPKNGRVYAVTGNYGGRPMRMHRVLCPVDAGMQVDHINRNSLDNRRCNLRPATNQQNSRNSRKKNNTSGYHGVSFDKRRGTWRAHLSINRRYIQLGRYSTAEEAARARDAASIEHFGEFAVLNFPPTQH